MHKNNKPYKEEILESGVIKRVFDANTDSHELTWHRDKKDRIVTVVNESDWMLQFDNDLPKKLIIGESVIIPKETYHRVIKGDSNLVVEIQEFDSLDEAKKKGKGKKDACYHKVKSRYSVWPSAYGSGALVQCRKVGAANWGNKSEDVEVLETEGDDLNYNDYEVHDRLSEKTDYSKEKTKGLHGWFERRGGEGSQGWVDCNTCRKDPDTGRKKCKPCGRKEGEDRAKYPSCRPTPSACKTKGKGKKWGKKSENTVSLIKNMLKEFVESEKIDEVIGIYRYEKDERMNEPAIVEPEVKPDVERTPKRKVGDSPFTPPAKRPSTKPKASR